MRRGRQRIALLIVLSLAGQDRSRAQTTPSRNVAPGEPSPRVSPSGSYYALVIGNSHYKYLGPTGNLTTPILDATEVAKVLHDTYGFETLLLLDADRNRILSALVDYRRTLAPDANLLIYYAGHGHHDRDADEAYWWPVDARLDNNANWISADDITRDIKAIPSLHVLVISDSCYSGALAEHRAINARMEPEEREALLAKLQSSKSRMLMSSGRDEPVTDVGAPGHSYFAAALLESLRTIGENSFTGAELFYDYVQPRVGGGSAQLPQYDWILNSGHQYGDFVFTRGASLPSVVTTSAIPTAAPATGPASSGIGRVAGREATATRTVGWALTTTGTLLHSENGLAWEPRKTVKGSMWSDSMAFTDSRNGWVIDGQKDLLHTEDGGQSWTVSLSRDHLRSVNFATPQSGWVMSDNALLHTEDAGHTWVRQQFIGEATWLNDIAFGGSRSAWLVGSGTISHTEDAGAHWVAQTHAWEPFREYDSATFVSEQEGWIVGADGVILHTRDGGTAWEQQSSGTKKGFSSVSFANSLSGWIVGSEGTILHTEDGGKHWVKQKSGTKSGLFAVRFVDAKSGWATGEKGILHTEDGGATWTNTFATVLEGVSAIALFPQP